jgi:hypothetical protein
MKKACTRKPEGGKLTVTRKGEIYRIFNEIFTTDFRVITDLQRIFGMLSFLAHFDPEFKGIIENLEVGRGGGCFKDIKMRLGPRCSPLLVIIS